MRLPEVYVKGNNVSLWVYAVCSRGRMLMDDDRSNTCASRTRFSTLSRTNNRAREADIAVAVEAKVEEIMVDGAETEVAEAVGKGGAGAGAVAHEYWQTVWRS